MMVPRRCLLWRSALSLVRCYIFCQVLGAGAQATYPSEFRIGWCYRPEWSTSEQCFDHRISAAHFQLRLRHFYKDGTRPPIREAFFVATMPVAYQREFVLACPGFMVLAFLLLAEARLYTHPPEEAAELVARAQAMLAMPEVAPHLEGLQHAWPLEMALSRYGETAERLAKAMQAPMSVDLVIPHCREDLSWLTDPLKLEVLPPRTRIFIYEKCGWKADALGNLTAQLQGVAEVIAVSLEDAVDPHTGLEQRRDECSAYLSHVVREYESKDMGDVTLFLHGDPGDHTPYGFISLLLRCINLGTIRDVGFVHLGSPRMVHTWNPCQDAIFERAVGRPMQPPLSTYCCSQFMVAKHRLHARPLSEYKRALQLVDGSVTDFCERIGPSYEKYRGARLSHCFFLEFMWHVIFGEQEDLPLRADDTRLPVALRLKDNEETLPSIWRSYMSPYIRGAALFALQGHERWLTQIREGSASVPREQLNYGDIPPDGAE